VVEPVLVRGRREEKAHAHDRTCEVREHRWTTGDGIEHVAYQCEVCFRWFDSPSVHLPAHEGDDQ
jgi:hypothetical protein